jgi:hypothetical protein
MTRSPFPARTQNPSEQAMQKSARKFTTSPAELLVIGALFAFFALTALHQI